MSQTFKEPLVEGNSILIEELWSAPKGHFLAKMLQTSGKNLLILSAKSFDEVALDLPFFTTHPVIDMPVSEQHIGADTLGERYLALQTISKGEPVAVVSTVRAAFDKLISPKEFSSQAITLKKGVKSCFEILPEMLQEMGYTQTATCTDKGEFAVRGGLIDLFPIASFEPVRIEFWGDDVESLRTFDPIGQKSIVSIDEVLVTPAIEQNTTATLFDYMGENCIIVLDDLLALEDRLSKGDAAGLKDDFLREITKRQTLYLTQTPIEELSPVRVLEKRGNYYSGAPQKISFEMFGTTLEAFRVKNPYAPLDSFLCPEGGDLLEALKKLQDSYTIHMVAENQAEENLLRKQANNAGHYEKGYLSSGFAIPEEKQIYFPVTEISKKTKVSRHKLRSTYHTPPSEVYEIASGEIVVHFNNGIGKFLGIEKKTNHLGVENEFFHLEYAEGAKLFVPIKDAHLISKYVGSDTSVPKMHTLGSKNWQKTREKTEQAILGYAKDLLELYARREMVGGFSFPNQDSDLMQSFEETFPFTETEDQLAAIASVKDDLTSQKAMDRLICGDVGYGKTEVAMRAAFKAVVDGGKQVAMLVPTTVLALQHYENFLERMQYFPVNVACLSRFRSAKENKITLEGLAQGSIDIVIGTHRLISKDVIFKDLGLVIIDEEQRFGVRAKEHLKKIKEGVDCLTLSATPIPRTLYMSVIGARAISVINTPPYDRIPIKTVITEPTDQLLKEALIRELSRDGQAYVIHNRVETIYSMADRIGKLVPQAKIVVGHGQMSSKELDGVFHAFKSGQADILVATSIVENGIDIPHANTILIDRADHFGLADLYQLRGRVGRWNRQSFCYFLIKKIHSLPEITRKRLHALAESSGYGGGMKLAMRDLEIRGAGDILGIEQSGHISSVGFYLYCKLLKKTVKTLQGKQPPTFLETKVDFAVDARLPENYVNAPSLRMEFYQRFGEAATLEEAEGIFAELQDRFGPAPEPAAWLYGLCRIRIRAQQAGYVLIKGEKATLTLKRNKVANKVLFSVPKTPQDLEQKLLEFL